MRVLKLSSNATYIVEIPGIYSRSVRGREAAMALANDLARGGRFVHISESDRHGRAGKTLIKVAPRRRAAYLARGGLGLTTGDAVRRLERQPYRVVCHITGWVANVPNMRAAMRKAKAWSKKMPGHHIRIHLPRGPLDRTTEVAYIRKAGPRYEVEFNQSLRGMNGLGLTLTDIACSDREYVQSWRNRVNGALVSGAIAAAIGGAAGGLVGSIIQKPIPATLLGAAVGWGAHKVWTAPFEIS